MANEILSFSSKHKPPFFQGNLRPDQTYADDPPTPQLNTKSKDSWTHLCLLKLFIIKIYFYLTDRCYVIEMLLIERDNQNHDIKNCNDSYNPSFEQQQHTFFNNWYSFYIKTVLNQTSISITYNCLNIIWGSTRSLSEEMLV